MNKNINKRNNVCHDFNIGTTVFILKGDTIIRCIITGIECHPEETTKKVSNSNELVDYSTKNYTLYEISATDKITVNGEEGYMFRIHSLSSKYTYHSSRVYNSIDDLLSDLRNSIEKSS